ncbi:MAG: YajQ family cyclic di-GMP-binding protein [bacterium]|nr:YajQ family cyclic di-GMP-binding protein [bacterium]
MPSFDVGSVVNIQEVKNAVNQTVKEVDTRYDFRDSNSTVEFKEKESQILINTKDKMRLGAIKDILTQKLAKRGVSLKSCEFADPYASGGDRLQQEVKIKQGLEQEELKKITKCIKDSKLKVSSQIQDDQVRVTGKKRDDLQEVIAHLKSEVKDIDLQFTNFRE